jgi:hypothetical protein
VVRKIGDRYKFSEARITVATLPTSRPSNPDPVAVHEKPVWIGMSEAEFPGADEQHVREVKHEHHRDVVATDNRQFLALLGQQMAFFSS